MSILAGILDSYHVNTAVDNSEFASADGDQALAKAMTASAAMDIAGDRLDKLMQAALSIAAVNPKTKEGRQMARIHIAEAMVSCSASDDEAVSMTSGLESDDEDLDAGNEAWSSIKDFVKSIIEWIQKQWRKFKKFVMKYWNKYFGDVERLQKAWTKVQEEAKTKQTGYTLEKNGKGDFDKTADYFYGKGTKDDAKLTGDDLAASIETYTGFARSIRENVLDLEFKDLEQKDVLNTDETDVLGAANIWGTLGIRANGVGDLFKGEVKATGFLAADKRPVSTKYALKASDVLAGRMRIYICNYQLETPAASMDVQIKRNDIVVDTVLKDQKKIKKATVNYVNASTIEEIADKNIELLTEIHGIQRSKRLTKITDDLDKASKVLDKWKNKAPDDKEEANKRTAYRLAVKIVTEAFSMQRRLLITAPLAFCQAARLVSSAHYDYATRCLKAHKKD